MFIPLMPHTPGTESSQHLLRPPMQPSLDLPWDNCYISIFVSAEARVAVAVTPEGATYELPPKEMARLQIYMSKDRERRTDIYQVDHPGEDPPPLLPPLSDLEVPDSETSHASFMHHEDHARPAVARGDGHSIVAEVLAQAMGRILESDDAPVINCSYDLTEVDKLNDPEDFYQEVASLNRYVHSQSVPIVHRI